MVVVVSMHSMLGTAIITSSLQERIDASSQLHFDMTAHQAKKHNDSLFLLSR